MSLPAKLAFAGSVVFAVSIVSYVHLKQVQEKENMREGVIRDIQRQERRKIQNLKMLQDQQELTKALTRMRDEEEKARASEQ